MSLKAYTNIGAKNCSRLERVADFFLAIPRVLWFGKSVQIINDVATRKRLSFYISSHEEPYDISAVGGLKVLCYKPPFEYHFAVQKFVGAIVFGALFVVTSIASSPLLLIGCAFKKLALKNQKALQYHNFVKLFIEKEELQDRIIDQTYQNRICKLYYPKSKQLNKSNKILSSLKSRLEAVSSEYVKALDVLNK